MENFDIIKTVDDFYINDRHRILADEYSSAKAGEYPREKLEALCTYNDIAIQSMFSIYNKKEK